MSALDAVRWGVMLPSFDPYGLGTPPLLDAARLTEDLGFDSGWVGDHLSFHPPVFEALCSLAAVGAVTERLLLGTNILLLALRSRALALAASQLGTLDALYPGRLVLGVGVGGEHPPEWEAAGVPVAGRGPRLDESLTVLDELLAGNAIDHDGRYTELHSPRIAPVPGRPLPLAVGGRSPAAIERAARRGDAWIGVWLSPAEVAERSALVAERAHAHRRPKPRVLLMVFANVDDDAGRAARDAAALFDGQYAMPYEVVERWTPTGPRELVAARLREYRSAGVDGFVLCPASPEPLTQIERFAAVRDLLTSSEP